MPAPLYPPREDGNTALCRVPGCDRIKYRGTTMCGKHWSERYSTPQRPIRAADRDGQGRKYCFGCRVWQEVSNFHKGSAKHMDGLKARCKKCSSREYRARTYGISAEKMDAMLKEQGGICAVDRKSTRLNSSHVAISYAVFCLKKKKHHYTTRQLMQ